MQGVWSKKMHKTMKTWEIWKTKGYGETTMFQQNYTQKEQQTKSSIDGSQMELIETFNAESPQDAYRMYYEFLDKLSAQKEHKL